MSRINKIVIVLCLIGLAPAEEWGINGWFERLNFDMELMNSQTAHIAWDLNTAPTELALIEGMNLSAIKSEWGRKRCEEANEFSWLNLTPLQKRTIYLLCRGPRLTENQSKRLSKITDTIQAIYTETQICIPKNLDICQTPEKIWSVTFVKNEHQEIRQIFFNDGQSVSDAMNTDKESLKCFSGEPDMEGIMTGDFSLLNRKENCNTSLVDEEIWKWAYESWRIATGVRIGRKYPIMVHLMNQGALQNNYHDIGQMWREELEIPNLRHLTYKLWSEIKPYYLLLHAVIRHILYEEYGDVSGFTRNGTIPAHLLRNMWSQNWSGFLKYFIKDPSLNIDEKIKKNKWSVLDMVKRADDFYSSLGLKRMTKEFWNNSIIERSGNFSKCHGTAANMFNGDDYRMIVCAKKSLEDFYVIHHEMGHIQYYMNYKDQPGVFQDGTNTAMQEAFGDAIFNGVMAPQHLNRLSLLEDKFLPPKKEEIKEIRFLGRKLVVPKIKLKGISNLKTSDPDIILLLTSALSRIPQIPFEFLVDEYRWELFEKMPSSNVNERFWELLKSEQGIHPPDVISDRSQMFDAAAKFHVADNTPSDVRYFIASFMQAQIMKGLCLVTVFDKIEVEQTLPLPLHRCDIYGSKRAGNLIRESLSLGASVPWPQVLYLLTGSKEISSQPLIEYYQPLFQWLQDKVDQLDIPVGW